MPSGAEAKPDDGPLYSALTPFLNALSAVRLSLDRRAQAMQEFARAIEDAQAEAHHGCRRA